MTIVGAKINLCTITPTFARLPLLLHDYPYFCTITPTFARLLFLSEMGVAISRLIFSRKNEKTTKNGSKMDILAVKTQKRTPNSIEISVQGWQELSVLIHSINGVKNRPCGVKNEVPGVNFTVRGVKIKSAGVKVHFFIGR